jgi:enoyl-CoA hydratase/carnithine racemase
MPVTAAREGRLGRLTLDRPEKAHAYDRALLEALDAAAASLADCAVIVVESTGDRAFCAGADLVAMKDAAPLDALELLSQRVFTRLARLPAVTIAAVQGAAIAGGFELALACDLRVAGPKARFELPETRLGILPSAGGTTRLARLVGPARAKAVILGGEPVDAPTALAWGLVHRLADDPKAAAWAWAEAVAQRDAAALRLAKETIDLDESAAGLARERTIEAILYSRRPR